MGFIAWLVSHSETNFEPSFSYFLCVKKFCCYQVLHFKFCKFSDCCFPVSWGYCSDYLVRSCWHRVYLFCEHWCVWWHDTHCSAITFHSGTVHMPLGHKSTHVKSSFPSPLLTCWDCRVMIKWNQMLQYNRWHSGHRWVTPVSLRFIECAAELQCKVTGAPHVVSVAAPELCPGRVKTAGDRL